MGGYHATNNHVFFCNIYILHFTVNLVFLISVIFIFPVFLFYIIKDNKIHCELLSLIIVSVINSVTCYILLFCVENTHVKQKT